MADQFILSGKVVLDSSGAEIPIKNLKKELKEAQIVADSLAAKFGESSKEAIAARNAVAQLKDSIADAKSFTDAFNPDRKFTAFSGALQGVVGGFSALQGAMGVFGSDAEAVEQTLKKVQSAMALSEGLNTVLDSIQAFKNLGTVLKELPIVQKAITAAQWLWNAAMAANPIVALVVAIGAVVAGIAGLISWFSKSSAEAKKNAAAVAESTRSLENNKKALDENAKAQQADSDFKIAMAKATGKSKEEVRKLILAEQDAKIALQEKALALERARLATDEYTLATMKANDADDEQVKKQEENVKNRKEFVEQINNNVKTGYEERLKLVRSFEIEDAQIATDAAKKKKEDAKNKATEAANAAKEANKKAKDDIRRLNQENELAAIADDDARAKRKLEIDFENAKKEIEQSKANAELKAQQLKALKEKLKLDEDALNKKQNEEEAKKVAEFENKLLEVKEQVRLAGIKDQNLKQAETIKSNYAKQYAEIEANENLNSTQKIELKKQLAIREQQELDNLNFQLQQQQAEKDIAKFDKIVNDSKLSFDIRKQAIDNEQAYLKQALANGLITQEEYNEKEKDLAAKRITIGDAEVAAKQAQLMMIGNALNNLANLAGQSTAVGKALAIASTTISTYDAAQKAYQSAFMPVPTLASPFLGKVYAGIAIAQGLMNVKKILSTKVPGPSGGAAGGTAAISASTVPTPPLPPEAGSTMINQAQVNQLATANATARAYVVESDVTNSQERIERINRAARIN